MVKSLVHHHETATGLGVLNPPGKHVGVLLTELLFVLLELFECGSDVFDFRLGMPLPVGLGQAHGVGPAVELPVQAPQFSTAVARPGAPIRNRVALVGRVPKPPGGAGQLRVVTVVVAMAEPGKPGLGSLLLLVFVAVDVPAGVVRNDGGEGVASGSKAGPLDQLAELAGGVFAD